MKEWRFRFLLIFFTFLLSSVVLKLFYWQVVSHEQFVLAASDQHLSTVQIEAPRGKIFASDGSLLVSNQQAFLLYASISDIKKDLEKNESYQTREKQIVEKIMPILLNEKISLQKDPNKLTIKEKQTIEDSLKEYLANQLNLKGALWVPLQKKISKNSADALEKLKIKGLGFEDQTQRFYPEGTLAGSLLGFVGNDSEGNDRGYLGIEGFYQDQLQGRSGKLTQEIDANGRPIIAGNTEESKPKEGLDVETTIDRTVQYTIEKYLFDAAKKFGSKQASVVVLDPKTGAVLGMANSPNYDPFKWGQFDDNERRNTAISDVYEPGSTFKIVTAASALDAGVVKPDTICPCAGPIEASGYEVQTWNNKYNPNSNMAQILEHSDNVGAAFWAKTLGKQKFLSYLDKFGFGKQTGIDLQGEETGLLKEPRDWSDIDMVTGAFGQGLSVTALQMASAAGIIANEGKLMEPFVVKKISASGKEVVNEPKFVRQVIKQEVASTMKELLLAAVENGEAKRIIPHGLRIGGKTGTAQIPANGKYDPNKTVASFVGFGPIENPKFVMIVKFVEPVPIYGAETAEPTFFKIAQDLYSYWGIPINQ